MPTREENIGGRPTIGVAVKYGLLQIPGLVAFVLVLILVRRWLQVPEYVLWILWGAWVVKDIALFPFVWRAYGPPHAYDRFRMVGRKGVALTRLDPDGYVRIKSERWQAEIAPETKPVEKGEAICVKAVQGLKLTVGPLEENRP